MGFFSQSLAELTAADIAALVNGSVAEDSSIEFKRELEFDAQGKIKETSRNKIARELVAFANADGGTVVIGIDETDIIPRRAKSIITILNPEDVADRLRRAIYEIVEPKMPLLEARGIRTRDTEGVIVLSVPKSLKAPHRVEPLKECFRRVSDESRPMTMREIQEMTLSSSYETQRLDDAMERLVKQNKELLSSKSWLDQTYDAVGAVSVVAMPILPLSIRKIIGNSDLSQVRPAVGYNYGNRNEINFPWRGSFRTRPILRGERRVDESQDYAMFEQVFRNGSATFAFVRGYTHDRARESGKNIFYIAWIFSTLATALLTIEKLRRAAGHPIPNIRLR